MKSNYLRIIESREKIFIGIEAGPSQWDVLSGFGFHRLGLTVLKNILEEDGWKFLTYYETIDRPSSILNDPILTNPNIVIGISTLTTTAPRAYELSKKIREINKRALIIMGGFHPTACPDESLDWADIIVRGEAEETIRELFILNYPLEKIKGISYWFEKEKIHNPDRPLLTSLHYSKPLVEPGLCRERVTPVLFGRGCPYRCKFCAVSFVMGPQMRLRPAPEVIEDLKYLVKAKARSAFFVDDNFFGDIDKSVELLRLIVAEKINIPIAIQMRADVRVSRNPEILDLMKKAGIYLACIGIEFVNDSKLKNIHKGLNLDQIIEFVTVMRKWKFSLYAMFIFGTLEDDLQTPANIINFMKKYMPYEIIQIMHFNPFPGTALYNELEERIFDKNWANANLSRIIWQHPKMNQNDQYKALMDAYKRWYSPINLVKIMGQKIITGQWEALSITPHFLKGIYKVIKGWKKIIEKGETPSTEFKENLESLNFCKE